MCWKNENETQIPSTNLLCYQICFVISLVNIADMSNPVFQVCHNQVQFSIYPGPTAS